MPLSKARGQMYDFVTHCHTHIRGACPHSCSYCAIQHSTGARMGHYTGPIRLAEHEFDVKYGTGKTIFIEHCNDLFAAAVPDEWISRVMEHCNQYPQNTYVFQTKNPRRYFRSDFPPQTILGITIESDIYHPQVMGAAPQPEDRLKWFLQVMAQVNCKTFLTVEPILKFHPPRLATWIIELKPDFLNIGADSKRNNLPEPSKEDIMLLLNLLEEGGIEVREKHNLRRLLGEEDLPF